MKAICTAGLLAAALVAGCAGMGAAPSGVERMYVFDCGQSRTPDVSRWSPGINVGQAREFSANCYLIRHAKGLMLWDSGYADSIAAMPNGLSTPIAVVQVTKGLNAQLKELGLAPTDIKHIAFSHTHSDHVGNANLFTAATLYMQEPEYDAAFGPTPQKFGFVATNYEKLRANPLQKLKGDHDVFGDGSVVIVSTPGHTPGHQSLLVRLPNTGAVILSGDMVHFQENWDARRVPAMNVDSTQTVASMNKVAALMEKHRAQLWINHDKAQSAKIAKSPAFHD
jgi:N-acyl homoserine lactone hydrolase